MGDVTESRSCGGKFCSSRDTIDSKRPIRLINSFDSPVAAAELQMAAKRKNQFAISNKVIKFRKVCNIK
jgi:hypothetical protein